MEKTKPVWLKTSEKEVQQIVDSLVQNGHSNEKISLILRDQYGIPSTRLYGKKLSEMTKITKSELKNLQKKLIILEAHFSKNKQDKKVKRKISTLMSQINKLNKHYSSKKE